MRAPRSGTLIGAIVLVAVMVGAVPAAAATTSSWATWQPLSGAGGAYTTSVQIAANPTVAATVTTDSRAGQVGVISGASTWLSEGTPVGAKYGSSLNQSYLNLRPRADNATSPSTTTYSFAAPTPASGWTFVLGDIDADAVRIQAIAADGHVLDAAELGFQGGFNYCAPGVVGKPSCTGDAADVPAWDPATLTLTGNAAAIDTSGASAWFEPSTPISSLSFIFTRRAGFPVYQTWFASIARDITGTVTDVVEGPLAGVAVSLVDANGTVVGTTTTSAGGTYAFPGFVATDGYTVRVTAPDGKIAVGSAATSVDLTDADGVADFTVREIVPVAVSGRVTDGAGNPVPGALVSVDLGSPITTDAQGFYLFDTVGEGLHTVSITPPPGYRTSDPDQGIVVPENSEVPLTGVDFVVAENPDIRGTVTAGGVGVAGVVVTAASGGDVVTAVTDATGAYVFPRLPLGGYVVTMATPDGYTAAGPVSRTETLVDADLAGVDFALARPGTVGGTVVADDGSPVAGVVVTIGGGAAPVPLTTDADGSYLLGDLPPGTYTATVTPPSGTNVVGPATRTVVITAAGEAFVTEDFTLADAVVPPVDPGTPGTPGTPGASGGGIGGRLPGTGLGPETLVWAGAGAAVVVVGAVLLVISRRRSRRD